MQNPLAAHRGTYRGLSPTDESAIGMGEARIVITDEALEFSLAAGHEIMKNTIPTAGFVPMTREEVVAQFKEGSESAKTSTGFKGGETGHPILLFGPDGSMVMWTGGMGDILGPTIMGSPGHWSALKAWIAGWLIDIQTGGGFPRFRYKGKTRKYT